ncbi:serine/threonine protein kinase [Streptomyces sp. A73]|nr:serine/threonine protein kinase [Streptomyces sp. A73]
MTDGAAAEVFTPLAQDDPASVAGYRLAARLGSGGMGKVYLSYTPGGRPVAIKVIRPDFSEDPEFRRRFQQEVRAAERVQGLYTAPVIDSDTEGPRPWLATAYVPGPSVAEAVSAHGRLPVPTVLFLVAGIAEALQVIHKAGIVHRDLKPSNVLLADDGPRVIDFGIARAADATSLTSSGVTIGTPSFMAPEQAAGERVTEATDIFALGQIAAYAAAGTPAFGEGTSHGVLYRIVHAEPALDGVPDELRELVTRCLAKDPADRPGLPDVLGMCRTASGDTELRRAGDWLPAAVAYKGINLSEGYFLAMADDPLKPRDLDDSDTATPSELTYLDTTIDGAELSIDEPNGKLVLLNNSQKGSLKTCRAETRFTDSVKLNQLSPGSRLCVRTSSGHLALVTYRGHAPESDPSNYVKLDVTVWRNAVEATDD